MGAPISAPAGSAGHPPPTEPRRSEKNGWPERKREIGWDFLIGLICTVLLIALKIWVGDYTAGQQANLAAYTLIQQRLTSASPRLDAVRVVNLGDLTPQGNPFSRTGQTETPRARLRSLLAAAVSQRPAAIGIDVDFSPDPGDSASQYVDPGDPFLFNFCLDPVKSRGVPIFLGVKRSLFQPSQSWLGDGRYRPLAASLAGPLGDPRFYFWSTTAAGTDRPLPTLAACLSSHVASRPPVRLPWPVWMAERVGGDRPVDDKTPLGRALLARKFYVDYSQLDSLMTEGEKTPSGGVAPDRETAARNVPLSAPCGSEAGPLCGKVVLIGDAKAADGTDLYPVLGKPVPGVYIHACAAYTLSRLPLYDLTPAGQIVLDLLFSLPLLIGLATLRVYAARKWERPLAVERLQGVAVLLMVLLVVTLGVGLVYWTRLLWDDFLLVVFALFLHPVAHRCVKNVSSPRSWRRGSLLFEHEEEPERHEES